MNGEEAKARLITEPFDALIINGKMPGGWSASEVHSWIGEKAASLEGHVIFTFSSVLEPEIRTFLQDKNLPYLVKPFEVGELITQTRRLLQKGQAAAAR